MESWEAVHKTLQYIEDNLAQEMEINDLAAMACLSPFYYQRLFSRLVGKPVMEYIKLRRLAHAADILVNNHSRIYL